MIIRKEWPNTDGQYNTMINNLLPEGEAELRALPILSEDVLLDTDDLIKPIIREQRRHPRMELHRHSWFGQSVYVPIRSNEFVRPNRVITNNVRHQTDVLRTMFPKDERRNSLGDVQMNTRETPIPPRSPIPHIDSDIDSQRETGSSPLQNVNRLRTPVNRQNGLTQSPTIIFRPIVKNPGLVENGKINGYREEMSVDNNTQMPSRPTIHASLNDLDQLHFVNAYKPGSPRRVYPMHSGLSKIPVAKDLNGKNYRKPATEQYKNSAAPASDPRHSVNGQSNQLTAEPMTKVRAPYARRLINPANNVTIVFNHSGEETQSDLDQSDCESYIGKPFRQQQNGYPASRRNYHRANGVNGAAGHEITLPRPPSDLKYLTSMSLPREYSHTMMEDRVESPVTRYRRKERSQDESQLCRPRGGLSYPNRGKIIYGSTPNIATSLHYLPVNSPFPFLPRPPTTSLIGPMKSPSFTLANHNESFIEEDETDTETFQNSEPDGRLTSCSQYSSSRERSAKPRILTPSLQMIPQYPVQSSNTQPFDGNHNKPGQNSSVSLSLNGTGENGYGDSENRSSGSGPASIDSLDSRHRSNGHITPKMRNGLNREAQIQSPKRSVETGSPYMSNRRMSEHTNLHTYLIETNQFRRASLPSNEDDSSDEPRLVLDEPMFQYKLKSKQGHRRNFAIQRCEPSQADAVVFPEPPLSINGVRLRHKRLWNNRYSDQMYKDRTMSEIHLDRPAALFSDYSELHPDSYIQSRPNIRSGFGGNYIRPNAGFSSWCRPVSVERHDAYAADVSSSAGTPSVLTSQDREQVYTRRSMQNLYYRSPSVGCTPSMRGSAFCLSQNHLSMPTIAWTEKSTRDRQLDEKLLRLIHQLPKERQNTVEMTMLLMSLESKQADALLEHGLEYRLREALELVPPTNTDSNDNSENQIPSLHDDDDACTSKSIPNGMPSSSTKCALDPRMTQSCYDRPNLTDCARENTGDRLNGVESSVESSSDAEHAPTPFEKLSGRERQVCIVTILRRMARCLAVRIAHKRQRLADAQQKVSRNNTEEKMLRNKLNDLFIMADHVTSPCSRSDSTFTMTDVCDSPGAQVVVRFDRWHNNMASVIKLLCQLARRLAWVDAKLVCTQDARMKLSVDDEFQISSDELNKEKCDLESRIREAQSLKAGLENCRLRLLDSIPPGLRVEPSTNIQQPSPEAENHTTQQTTLLRDRVADHLMNTLKWLVSFHSLETEIRVDQEVCDGVLEDLHLEVNHC